MITTLELNKIYNIDCLVGMTEIPDQSIDMIFVDLPYGVTAKNKWDIDLCRYAIRTYTNEGDTVLDCCCGSGSIPLAAMLEGRNYIGMDNGICEKKNSKYCGWSWADVATDRIENHKE